PGLCQRREVDIFDSLAKAQVVTQDHGGAHAIGCGSVTRLAARQQALAPTLKSLVEAVIVGRATPVHPQPQRPLSMYQVIDYRALQLHGEVETGARASPVVRHIFKIVENIDSAHKAYSPVDHAGLAMHAAQ